VQHGIAKRSKANLLHSLPFSPSVLHFLPVLKAGLAPIVKITLSDSPKIDPVASDLKVGLDGMGRDALDPKNLGGQQIKIRWCCGKARSPARPMLWWQGTRWPWFWLADLILNLSLATARGLGKSRCVCQVVFRVHLSNVSKFDGKSAYCAH
jgi:hypothetical protein